MTKKLKISIGGLVLMAIAGKLLLDRKRTICDTACPRCGHRMNSLRCRHCGNKDVLERVKDKLEHRLESIKKRIADLG